MLVGAYSFFTVIVFAVRLFIKYRGPVCFVNMVCPIMRHVNSISYTISKLTMAVRENLIVLVLSIFKNSNLVVNIAVSNVRIQIYLFLKSNVYILNIEVFCSTMLFNKNLDITF